MTWHDGCPLGWLWTHKPGSTEGWASGVLADDEGERALPRHGVWSCSSACVFSYKTLPSITNQQRNNSSVHWFTRSCMDLPDSSKLVWRQHLMFYVLSHVWILTTVEISPSAGRNANKVETCGLHTQGLNEIWSQNFQIKINPDLNFRMATCHSLSFLVMGSWGATGWFLMCFGSPSHRISSRGWLCAFFSSSCISNLIPKTKDGIYSLCFVK